MKILKFFLVVVIVSLSCAARAQTGYAVKKDTVKVWGNCEKCEAKIEKAAKVAGATAAKWDSETQILTVSYHVSNASMTKIEKSVAAAGYDTANETANDKAYKKLDGCCQYDRKTAKAKEANNN